MSATGTSGGAGDSPSTGAPLTTGQGGLPCLALASPDGARAEVYLHGAQVTSWRPAGETEDRLFLSARSRFAAGSAIRGGVPISFPQFADQGPLKAHGFARIADWVLDGDAAPNLAGLRLEPSPAMLADWPHPFRLRMRVEVAARTLSMALTVENTGNSPLSFTGALHTYLRVRDIGKAAIRGLAGSRYRDKVSGGTDVPESNETLAITGETDRVYHAAPAQLMVEEPGRRLAIRATGFPDTVVWNPGARAPALGDMEPGGERHMLCVEAAASSAPIVVAPGQRWRGTQTLTAA